VICLDGVSVRDFDYLDIGEVMEPSGVVPLMVRSLLFPQATPAGSPDPGHHV
jgi:ethanolamine utilization protein EutA